MSDPQMLTTSADRLTAALAEYEMARDEGHVDRPAFLAQHADIANELEPLLAACTRIDDLTGPLRHALCGKPPQPFPRPEGYEILEEIGRGGMGVVYKARQQGTEQLVALKMLHPEALGRLDGDSRGAAIEQFRLEVKAAARLRHPNLVRIHHLGEHEGHPFYAMEIIEGRSLADRLKQPEGVSKEKAVKYLAGVADAVHEAHQQGILHRDIKPHNILIDERSDEALLADFGLALVARTAATSEDSVRHQARLAGTIPYMSPEQTRDSERVTAASDVYSLGATLYELLTGVPPFHGQARTKLLERIRTEEPAPPRRHHKDVSPRVEQICLRCLHKDPARRYATAGEFAAVLRRYLQEVRYARHFTSMGTLMMGLGPVVLLINLAVYFLLRNHVSEVVIWPVIFSMYPALFTVFLLAPGKDGGADYALFRVELWSIWTGKMFAALAISIALRMAFPAEPERALLLVYPVFAALSGMAVFIQVSKMERKIYFLPFFTWLMGIIMVFRLERGPLIYGIGALIGVVLYGAYLRRLGKEMS